MLGKDIADVNLSVVVRFGFGDNLGNSNLMRVPYHPVHPWQYRQLFGSALRVTASDQDARRRILAMHAMDGLANIFIGERRDGATV